MEFPVFSNSESQLRPTAMLYRIWRQWMWKSDPWFTDGWRSAPGWMR